MARTTFFVGVYELDREFGGSEEGGWWYDTGDLQHVSRVFTSEDSAYAFAHRYNDLLRFVQRGKCSIGSVIYNGGRYGAYVWEQTAPKFFPEERPRYE